MSNTELDKALAQLKKANEKHTRLQKEYDSARAKCELLTQLSAEIDKLKSKYEGTLAKWHELDKQFDDGHKQLIDAIDDALNEWYKAKQHVKKIIDKLTGANND
ncbi:hypothetical protein [Gardnerella sp. DNF01198P]|uniref:hypothetical protein n=1 Tax=Gardnerella sp. DNF01198P TaxID=2749066 RepID=UPI003BABCE9E